MIEAGVVVVPVHDEEERLPACLAAVQVACAGSGLAAGGVAVVVVLDDCTDASAELCELLLDPVSSEVVVLALRNVGAARRAGVAAALARFPDVSPDCLWLATTDADSVVPPTWLADQVALADAGADGVAGTVEVEDWTGHPPHVPLRHTAIYSLGGEDDHPHVHGTNLGVRASAYLAAGGFEPLACSEDHDLWGRLSAGGHRLVATRRNPVLTSGRRRARAPGGFATWLSDLAG